jgi:hypothetical protein
MTLPIILLGTLVLTGLLGAGVYFFYRFMLSEKSFEHRKKQGAKLRFLLHPIVNLYHNNY